MFGPFRRFPFRGLALVAFGFLLASVLAGGGSAASGAAAGLGFFLVLPLLLFKMLFMFFLFGALFRFAGGGWRGGRGPGWGRGGPWHSHRYDTYEDGEDDDYSWTRGDRYTDRDRWEWEESIRQAKEDLREHDRLYPRPSEGFEPPKPADGPKD